MHKLLLNPEIAGGNGAGSPASAPAAAPSAPAPDFVDGMMAEMAAASTPKTPEPAAKTPELVPAAKPDAAKPTPAAAKPPVADTKPQVAAAAKPESVLDWKSAPKQFKEAHEKLKAEFETTKKTLDSQLASTKQQMQALESRKFLTPEQEEKYQNLEKRQQEIEADLYARDWRESPEFKAKYVTKTNKIFQTLQNELKGIQIIDGENQRPATLSDFSKIRALGNSMVEQRRAAKEIFGDDADVVLGMARELKAVEDAANEEIDAKRSGWESEKKKASEDYENNFKTGKTAYEEYDKQLVEKFPNYFAPIADNPEFNAALEKGIEYVDSNSKSFNEKNPAERAQIAALMRRWASVWPANQTLIKQQLAKISELEAKVQKLQGSDPGAGGETGAGGGKVSGDIGGTDALSIEIEKLSKM